MYSCLLFCTMLLTNDRKGLKSFKMVTRFFHPLFSFKYHRNISDFVLSFLWLAGFLFGAVLASRGVFSFSLWMRTADFGSMSIVWLFFTLLLPFLFSAFAVSIRQKWLIYVFAFFKAFLFSFCLSGILGCCYGAGWLVCFLLFFSEFFLMPWLFFFMLRCLRSESGILLESSLFSAVVFLAVSVDRCFISPFLASLI